MTTVKRAYRSPRRREQAQATRQRILAAARRLFIANGYGATTVESIARHAGVAVQTVYASLGSKRAMLFALLDQMAIDADLPRMEATVAAAAGDPPRQLRERVAFSARFYAKGGKLIDIARTVSGVEEDLQAMWREGESRRHRAARALVDEWKRAGVLAPGLSAARATDILWALSGPDTFRLFVVERRWGIARFEEWLYDTLAAALFG
ncbi:MAG TPA: helix-turn-helix domain-containing protein [Thermoleophilaceae bacterium]|nr:helix-turn-helix domain-containing protein [Thermoleophilaceae bacterium]